MSGTWESLTCALAGVPRLTDAACHGLWELFDPPGEGEDAEDVAYRHSAALKMCASCPCLSECRSYVDSLKPSQRPIGVIAGRVVREHNKRAAA